MNAYDKLENLSDERIKVLDDELASMNEYLNFLSQQLKDDENSLPETKTEDKKDDTLAEDFMKYLDKHKKGTVDVV